MTRKSQRLTNACLFGIVNALLTTQWALGQTASLITTYTQTDWIESSLSKN